MEKPKDFAKAMRGLGKEVWNETDRDNMNCALCKGSLKKGRVNHITDLGDGIIIIKLEEIIEELRKNKAEVLIINIENT